MLEVNYTNSTLPFYFSFTVFLKTVVFMPLSFLNFSLFQNLLAGNKKLREEINSVPVALNPALTVIQNLDFLSCIFSTQSLVMTPVKYFNLEKIVNKKLTDIAAESNILISLAPLFFKQSNIWCIFIEDEKLSENAKNKISILIKSKIENSNSIVFYATSSGNSFDIENQINFT